MGKHTFVLMYMPQTKAANVYIGKGQEISEDFFLVINSSKNQRDFLLISALASKKWLNQKNIKQFIMLNRPY